MFVYTERGCIYISASIFVENRVNRDHESHAAVSREAVSDYAISLLDRSTCI